MAKVTLKTATDAQLARAIQTIEAELETTRLGSKRESDLLAKLDAIEREREKRAKRSNPSAKELGKKVWAFNKKIMALQLLPAKVAYEHPEWLLLAGPEMAPVVGGLKAVKAARKNRGKKRKIRTEAQFRAALGEIEARRGADFALRGRRKAGAHKDKTKYARRRKHRGSED